MINFDDDSTLDLPGPDTRPRADDVPALTVLWHADSSRVGERTVLRSIPAAGCLVSRNEPEFHDPSAPEAGRPLADPYVSRRALLIQRSRGGALRLEAAAAAGVTVDGRELDGSVEVPRQRMEAGAVLVLARQRVALVLHLVSGRSADAAENHGLIGASQAMERVHRIITRAAGSRMPVLVQGESGTGKELVARALHAAGRAPAGPLIAVNMATLAAGTAASELFGHVRGAFTGATGARQGHFAAADGGTLFLDEMGAAPAEVQAMLLRVLETGEFTPVGASHSRTADVRVVAATDARLPELVARGAFSLPLYHRLLGCAVILPPLRERRSDVGLLLRHFLAAELALHGAEHRLTQTDPRANPWLHAREVAGLALHTWPGNVRELRNVAHRLAVDGHDRTAVSVPADVATGLRRTAAAPSEEAPPQPPRLKPADIDDALLITTLEAHGWSVRPAARALGISKTSLYGLIDRCSSIRSAGDVPVEELRAAVTRHGDDVAAMAGELRVSPAGLRLRLRDLG